MLPARLATTEQLLLKKFNQLPESLKVQVLDFMEYLSVKYAKLASPVLSQKPLDKGTPRVFGFGKGTFTYIAPDFNDTPPEFEAYMTENELPH